MKKVNIVNWRYSESEEWDNVPAGWRCIIHLKECNIDIVQWMEQTMTGVYECDCRFNNGNPIYTIYIQEQRDAEFFILALQ